MKNQIVWYILEEEMGCYPVQEYGPYYSLEDAERDLERFNPDDDINRWIEKVVPKPTIFKNGGILVHKEF